MLLQHVAGGINVAAVAVDVGQPVVLDLRNVDRRVPGGEQRRGADRGGNLRTSKLHVVADQRSLFRYDMHTLPSEISSSIGTSTLLAAWNAAIYVAQIEDDRLSDVNSDRRYIDATRDVLQKQGGLWFYDELFVISHRRD